MTDIDMKAMCDSAMVRLNHSINRSAGQHMRAMREPRRMTNDEFLSDLLYCAHMGELPESTIAEACERFGIDFPPKRHDHETNLISTGEGSKRIWASAQNTRKSSVQNQVRKPVGMY